MPEAAGPLSRYTVLDLTRVRSGPTCVRQLADYGAVEEPHAMYALGDGVAVRAGIARRRSL